MGPSFSLFALASIHSGSAKKAFHFFSRSARDSHASIYVKSLASGPTRVFLRTCVSHSPPPRGCLPSSPKPDLLDSVLLPDAQSMVLEPRQKIWHAARERGVDAQFVNHSVCLLVDQGSMLRSLCVSFCGMNPTSTRHVRGTVQIPMAEAKEHLDVRCRGRHLRPRSQ